MANFNQLKQSVAALIRTNGAEEITGQIMQDVLLTIINSISGGYMFGGVAQHSGNVGNPDYNVFYLAGSGAYTGYGDAINIPNGCYGVFRYNGSWTQDVVDIGVHLTGTIREGETNGVTGDVINTALQQLFNNVMNILDTLTFTYNTPSAQQATKAMLDVIVTPTGGASHVLTTLTLVSATAAAAGLMSAEDKQKVDRMLTDFRSLSFSDTTAVADQATKIVQTLSATLGENPEAITTMTFLAATASKAGLLSAADKAKLDALWSSGYQFAGIATPSTTPISTTSKIFYIATEAGTYFNTVTVTQGINIIYKSGDTWSVAQVVGIDNEPTAGSDRLVKSGGVFGELALGAVYDVSAKNPTAGPNSNGKWESLSALLSDANLNTLIPTSVRKGGMSIKYVQSSDNKYIQFRCMSNEFTTDITNWQNTDTSDLNGKVFGSITKNKTWSDGYINAQGVINNSSASKFTQPFLLKRGEGVIVGTENTNVTIIGTTASSELSVGDTITPIKKTSTTAQFETYSYVATEDIYIVLCVKFSNYTLSFFDTNNLNTIEYDISEANNGVTYADLSEALGTNGANIPLNMRKGGMKVKFIRNSDNMCVRYELIASTWSAEITNWRSVDYVTDVDKNHAQRIVLHSKSRKYSSSSFQLGYISPTTGQNAYNNSYIRTEVLLQSTNDFYLLISDNIRGFIYYYSEYNLNSFTGFVELVNNVEYYIPVDTYYRLVLCNKDMSTPNISTIVDNVIKLQYEEDVDIAQNQTEYIIQNSQSSKYPASGFQSGYISPTTGQNTVNSSYIRSEALLLAKDDFYIVLDEDIKGFIYYYSEFNVSAFDRASELKSNVAYYIPVGTYYRLAFRDATTSTPVIANIIDNVEQLRFSNPDISKLKAITTKKFDDSIFQSGYISTETGTNEASNYYVRTTALINASETFLISLPDNIQGRIYYYSQHLLTSYTGYEDLAPNSLTYVGKGTEYRLVFYYKDYALRAQPIISEITGAIDITYNFIDRFESLDFNADSTSWYAGGIAVDTGELVTEQYNKRIRCSNIKKSEYSIWATGCYRVSVYVYNGSTYLGCLNDNEVLSQETIKWWSKIDLTVFASKNPNYKFKIVACRADSNGNPIEDVMTAVESENVKMLTPFEMELFVKNTFCPIVSFIDDDIPDEAMENWYSIGNDTGIRCGFAVPTASISEDRWKQIKRLQSDGFDFLSHTHNHINLMNTDPEVIAADLQLSVEAFTNHGIKVNALVYPQSSINDAALTVLKKYFEYSFNGGRGLSSIQGNPLRQHNITRSDTVESALTDYTDPNTGITYQVHAMLPLSDLKACVDKAVEENCWVIFESHFRNSRTTDPNTNDGFIFTPEMRQNVIELIRYAVSRGCKVLTPSEGYNVLKNRLKRGTYGGGSYYIVDHNGFVYRKNM